MFSSAYFELLDYTTYCQGSRLFVRGVLFDVHCVSPVLFARIVVLTRLITVGMSTTQSKLRNGTRVTFKETIDEMTNQLLFLTNHSLSCYFYLPNVYFLCNGSVISNY